MRASDYVQDKLKTYGLKPGLGVGEGQEDGENCTLIGCVKNLVANIVKV